MMKFNGFMQILDEYNRAHSSNWPKKPSQAVDHHRQVDEPPIRDDHVNDCQCRMCLDERIFQESIVSYLTKTLDSAPFKKCPRFKIPKPEHARNDIIESSYWKERIDAIENHQNLDSKFIKARIPEMFPIENFVAPIIRMRDLMYRLQVDLEERRQRIRFYQDVIDMARNNITNHHSRSYENYGP